jgi:hypothetical protein
MTRIGAGGSEVKREVICDFCSGSSVRWSYPAKTFRAFVGTSVGDWAACERCHHLIESGDRDGLMKRSLITFIVANPDMEPRASEVMRNISALHAMFFENRTGARRERVAS